MSGTAQRLAPPTTAPSVAYVIRAAVTNISPVAIGDATVTTSTGFLLYPGESFDYGRNDQNATPRLQLNVFDFYVVGTVGDKISWLATP